MNTKILLNEDQIPKQWYNIIPDMPGPLAPVIHPGTLQPVTPDDLLPLFPMGLIEQEVCPKCGHGEVPRAGGPRKKAKGLRRP